MCGWVRLPSFMLVLPARYLSLHDLVSGGAEAGFGYWAGGVFGNLFVIGLEGFIVTIQTMRLHYYEFFSKFFRGGGSPYEPLALASARKKSNRITI